MENDPKQVVVRSGEEGEAGVLSLSREFVHRFWDGDIEWCFGRLAPDFSWIGAQCEQFDMGRDTFRVVHAQVAREIPNIILVDEEYRCLPFSAQGVFVVIGQYLAYTDPASDMIAADKQRVTLVWQRGEDGFMLAHYHVSNPLKPSLLGEVFPVSFAKETYRFMLARAQQVDFRSSCELRDVEGSTHFMHLSDVVYLEASKQSTVVHCLESSFRVRGGISDIASQLDSAALGMLVRTHRSFAVNALYVERIDRDAVVMTTGAKLALSARRRAEVRSASSRPGVRAFRRFWRLSAGKAPAAAR